MDIKSDKTWFWIIQGGAIRINVRQYFSHISHTHICSLHRSYKTSTMMLFMIWCTVCTDVVLRSLSALSPAYSPWWGLDDDSHSRKIKQTTASSQCSPCNYRLFGKFSSKYLKFSKVWKKICQFEFTLAKILNW